MVAQQASQKMLEDSNQPQSTSAPTQTWAVGGPNFVWLSLTGFIAFLFKARSRSMNNRAMSHWI
jgi:hypothetical protein